MEILQHTLQCHTSIRNLVRRRMAACRQSPKTSGYTQRADCGLERVS